jgi:hypothetical protein
VVSAGPLNEQFLGGIEVTEHDVLLVDRCEDAEPLPAALDNLLGHWAKPVLFNDSMATELSLRQGNPEFGRLVVEQISALLPPDRT